MARANINDPTYYVAKPEDNSTITSNSSNDLAEDEWSDADMSILSNNNSGTQPSAAATCTPVVHNKSTLIPQTTNACKRL